MASDSQAQRPPPSTNPKTTIGNWTFANWPLYIDKKVIKDFNKEFGGNCKYVEEINDNFEFFGKVRQQLQSGKPIGRDIVDAHRLHGRPLGAPRLPPADRQEERPELLQPRGQPQDDQLRPEARVHAAVAVRCDEPSGTTSRRPGRELKSINDLFDPKFKGKVTMLSEPYDSASAVLLGEGVDASKASLDQLLGAIEKIDKANQAGQFRRFTGNDYTQPLAKGDIWVALAYSGDMVQLQSDNPDLRFTYAEEGCPALHGQHDAAQGRRARLRGRR